MTVNSTPTDVSAERLNESGSSPRVHDGDCYSLLALHVDGSRLTEVRGKIAVYSAPKSGLWPYFVCVRPSSSR